MQDSLYKETDGLKYIMEKKEKSGRLYEFPEVVPNGTTSFTHIFSEIEAFMNSEIHKHVVDGAAVAGDCMLNDHGAGHIAMVMARAYMLVKDNVQDLKGYEIFFLLLSIHFHDVGNIYGRDAHEEKICNVFEALGDKFPLDSTARRLITNIAMSHGGNHDGDKDTLAYVQEKVYIDGIAIRTPILAALLRFADEIADDKNRASSVLATLKVIPKGNKAFHEYSRSLEPPVIEGDTLLLHYNIRNDLLFNRVSKLDNEVFLYDEILSRIQKCLCELDYCKRYSQGFIHISCLSITINILDSSELKEIYKICFKAKITGYPDKGMYNPVFCSDPEVPAKTGEELITLINKGN